MHDQLSDEQLMGRYQRCLDEAALDMLVSRHLPAALGVAGQMLTDAALAEDAVQEALLRVVRGRKQYATNRPFGSWFYAILRNVCRDMLRRRARQAHLIESAAERLQARRDGAEQPSVPAEGTEMLDTLSPRLQAVLRLRVLEGMSFAEVAAALGIGEEAAKKRAQRGLRQLRQRARARRLSPPRRFSHTDVPEMAAGTYASGTHVGTGQ